MPDMDFGNIAQQSAFDVLRFGRMALVTVLQQNRPNLRFEEFDTGLVDRLLLSPVRGANWESMETAARQRELRVERSYRGTSSEAETTGRQQWRDRDCSLEERPRPLFREKF